MCAERRELEGCEALARVECHWGLEILCADAEQSREERSDREGKIQRESGSLIKTLGPLQFESVW